MNLLKKLINVVRRFKMCLDCLLDPEECGYANKTMKNGNCTKVERKE